MQIIPKHYAFTLGRQAVGMRVVLPLVTQHNRFYGDKLGHGDFHPYNIPEAVRKFFVEERDSHLAHLKAEQHSCRYDWQDWITLREQIASYKKIKTILDMQIADDATETALVLQNQSKAVAHTLGELEEQLARIENIAQKQDAKCSELKKRVEAYDKILQKIQKKP